MKRRCLAIAVVSVLGVGGAQANGGADETSDYDPQSWAWNGMAQFVALAEGMGFEVSALSHLEWSTLGRGDILLVVYPQNRIDPRHLSDFVQAGGNAVIADDFGEAGDALAQLGVLRSPTDAPRASRYYDGRLWAPVATAAGDHAVARDVGEVVTNHPKPLQRAADSVTVVGFADSALVVAGERGAGKFVAIGDPSILINRMQQEPFQGNVQLTANILRWLSRGGQAHRIVVVHGDFAMYGQPRPFIDDPSDGSMRRAAAQINGWMYDRREWVLGAGAMKALALVLVLALLGLTATAVPIRRGRKIHGLWLRFSRPLRRDDPCALLRQADAPAPSAHSLLVVACVLRDRAEAVLAEVLAQSSADDKVGPLYAIPEAELIARATARKGAAAGAALAKVHRRLRALPSRGQVAAPWSAGTFRQRDFEMLYGDVRDLCRTLGHEI